MEEVWKDIDGFPGYQASTLGRIRSHNKVTKSSRFPSRHWKDRIIKQKVSAKDHCCRVSLWADGKNHDVLVHRIIANTFLEPLINTNMTVNHKDGNRLNNCIDNLEWLTLGDNIRHGFKTGLYNAKMIPCSLIDSQGKEFGFKSLTAASRFLSRNAFYIRSASSKTGVAIDKATGEKYKVVIPSDKEKNHEN